MAWRSQRKMFICLAFLIREEICYRLYDCMIIIFIFNINKNSLGVKTCSSRSILVNIRLSKYRIWKATGLTTNCHVHHAFLYIYLLSLHDYNVKVSYFMICWGQRHKITTFFFFSWTLIQSLEFNSKTIKLVIFHELNEKK